MEAQNNIMPERIYVGESKVSTSRVNLEDIEYIRADIAKERELELIEQTILRCITQIENNRGLPEDDLFDLSKMLKNNT